jgi:hypothetical protein
MLRTGHQIYNTSDSKSHPSSSTYKWDENSTQHFQNAMSSTRIDFGLIKWTDLNPSSISEFSKEQWVSIRHIISFSFISLMNL